MAPDWEDADTAPRLPSSPVQGIHDLDRLLNGQTPVTDFAGNLRVEIIGTRGRRNLVLWVPWDEALRLLALHGNRAALLTHDTPTGVLR